MWTIMPRATLCALLSLLACRGASAAEPGTIEYGFDGGISGAFYDGGRSEVTVSLSPASLRVGVFAKPSEEIEASLSGALLHFFGTEDETEYAAALGLHALLHLRTDRTAAMPYAKAGPLLLVTGNGRREYQLGFEGGGGVKVPVGRSAAVRFEADLAYFFERESGVGMWVTKFPSAWVPSLAVGLSIFTR